MGATLPNLRFLEIKNCACFNVLAALGQLPNLEALIIKDAYSVVSVEEEFLWGGIQSKDTIAMSCLTKPAFPKLSELYFIGMSSWKEWQWTKGQPAMPKLKKLSIRACPQLRSLPEGLSYHSTSLEFLHISGAAKLTIVENLPTLKRINVVRNPILERISNLPNISYILITECPNLKVVENLKALQTVELIDSTMKILPDFLMTAMPQNLIIRCSEVLLLKIASLGNSGSDWNRFKHIPKVNIYSPGECFYATYQKTPFSFTTNRCPRPIQI